MILEILNISLGISFLLIVWFKTNAFCEYLEYFRFENNFFINSYYKERKKIVNDLHYTDFLLIKNNCFFIRLITCPICLGVWLNILASFFFNFQDFFIRFYLSTSLYYLYCILINKSHD
jgi:hypothetical protein